MLYLNTVDPTLFEVLKDLCKIPELSDFALVGGTSLALQIGHRKSDDLDFFTNRTFDINEVKSCLIRYNSGIEFLKESRQGFSSILPMPGSSDDKRKVDVYNWAVKFIRPFLRHDGVTLGSLEDIAALKLDAICYRKEKKDYFDIAMLLRNFSFKQQIEFYKEKFPANDIRIVLDNILDLEGIEKSGDPIMLVNLELNEAVEQIRRAVITYSMGLTSEKELRVFQKDKKVEELLAKGKRVIQRRKGDSI